jgi:hypothetical protein
VLMPLLGWAKLRLGERLDSGATAGEGVQNMMCAVQAGAALVAVAGAGIGLSGPDGQSGLPPQEWIERAFHGPTTQ